jgi:hypothetical protein
MLMPGGTRGGIGNGMMSAMDCDSGAAVIADPHTPERPSAEAIGRRCGHPSGPDQARRRAFCGSNGLGKDVHIGRAMIKMRHGRGSGGAAAAIAAAAGSCR